MSVEILLLLIWLHFFADFILQTDWMAINKSKKNLALGIHVVVYSLPFLVISPLYAIINGIAHFATDWLSSRATTKLWEKEQRHWFFVVIGADQAVHMSTLVATYYWLIL